jgi:ankyrin repeat protein
MLDTRGGTRQGFPKEVAAAIFCLSHEYDRLNGSSKADDADSWANIEIAYKRQIEDRGCQFTLQGFLKSVDKSNTGAVSLYLDSGFPLETRDDHGWTALMISSFNGDEEIAKLLILKGANVNANDDDRYGPMHWAAYNGYANVIRLLIIRRANVNARNRHGWTPLLQATTFGHLAACGPLLAGGANVNLARNDG